MPCRPLLTRRVPQAGVWRRGGAAGGDLRAGPRHPGQERPLRCEARGAWGSEGTRCRSFPRGSRSRSGLGFLCRPSAAASLLFLLGFAAPQPSLSGTKGLGGAVIRAREAGEQLPVLLNSLITDKHRGISSLQRTRCC